MNTYTVRIKLTTSEAIYAISKQFDADSAWRATAQAHVGMRELGFADDAWEVISVERIEP
jgi:hypothetical protein